MTASDPTKHSAVQRELIQRVIEITADQAGKDAKEITLDSHYMNHLGLDSLDCIELVMEIEDEWAITITDDEAERCKTVRQVVELIERKEAEQAAG